jgi:starvation-inducible DNA-binding protein
MPYHYSGNTQHHITTLLCEYLADTAIVYYKTHTFHWNVEGPNFYGIHLMFEKLYTTLWESMDETAEHIRTLGEKVPASYADLLKLGSIEESETTPLSNIMVQVLRDDHITLSKKAYEVSTYAESQKDMATVDIMAKHAAFLEKACWMLQSSIGE